MNGARYLAEMFKAYGVSHVFYVDAILRKAMVDFDELGIRRVLTHSEKAAAIGALTRPLPPENQMYAMAKATGTIPVNTTVIKL